MTFSFQGRDVALPVEVRDASSWSAQYLVPAAKAQALIAHTGLRVAKTLPGKAMVSLVFVRYRDSDLDTYNEVGIGFLVREHDAVRRGVAKSIEVMRQQVGVYIHQLPVNQTFTLEAGRGIWGYPKFLAEIALDEHANAARCSLRHDGKLILRASVRNDGRLRMKMPTPPTYTMLDGTLRRTRFQMPPTKAAARFGGATLELGDHPIANELRSLGLPKRALMSQHVAQMRATFGDAEVIRATEPAR